MNFVFQHANEDVERMILGNKCDIEDKRQVSRERGTIVSFEITQMSGHDMGFPTSSTYSLCLCFEEPVHSVVE